MIERNSRYGSCALCHKMPGDHRMLEQRTYIAIDLKSFYATDYEALESQRQKEQAKLDKERRMQEAKLKIKKLSLRPLPP